MVWDWGNPRLECTKFLHYWCQLQRKKNEARSPNDEFPAAVINKAKCAQEEQNQKPEPRVIGDCVQDFTHGGHDDDDDDDDDGEDKCKHQ